MWKETVHGRGGACVDGVWSCGRWRKLRLLWWVDVRWRRSERGEVVGDGRVTDEAVVMAATEESKTRLTGAGEDLNQ